MKVSISGLSEPRLDLTMPGWTTVARGPFQSRHATKPIAGFHLRGAAGDAPLVISSRGPGRFTAAIGTATAITLRYEIPLDGSSRRDLPHALGQLAPPARTGQARGAVHKGQVKGESTRQPKPIRYHEAYLLRGTETWLSITEPTRRTKARHVVRLALPRRSLGGMLISPATRKKTR